MRMLKAFAICCCLGCCLDDWGARVSCVCKHHCHCHDMWELKTRTMTKTGLDMLRAFGAVLAMMGEIDSLLGRASPVREGVGVVWRFLSWICFRGI